MIKEKIENKELQRLIAMKCGKVSFEEVTDEEIEAIFDIAINSRLINGKESGITLDVLPFFKGLKRLIVSNYIISQEQLDMILSSLDLESITFSGVEFQDVTFERHEQLPRSIYFESCLNMPYVYPRVSNVRASGIEIDMTSIDFTKAKRVTIHESIIRNAHDLVDFDEIDSVDIDGSRLFDQEGNKKEEIKVSPKTRYTHQDRFMPYDRKF